MAPERDDQLLRWAQRGQRMRSARMLRWAGALIGFGLLVEAGSLFWSHPLAFVFFILLGVVPIVLGVGAYLVLLANLPISTPDS